MAAEEGTETDLTRIDPEPTPRADFPAVALPADGSPVEITQSLKAKIEVKPTRLSGEVEATASKGSVAERAMAFVLVGIPMIVATVVITVLLKGSVSGAALTVIVVAFLGATAGILWCVQRETPRSNA